MADNRWAVKNGLGNALKNMDSIEFWDNYQSFMLDEIETKKKMEQLSMMVLLKCLSFLSLIR